MAAMLIAAACGGDDGGPSGVGKPVTDPAKVPSSTPIQNGTLYQIRGDVISTSGGVAGTVSPIAGLTPTGARTYTVKGGDTCAGIAADFKVTVDELLKANRTIDSNCSNLRPGDQLRIPSGSPTPLPGGATPTPRPGSPKDYTVKSGDTCGAIAANFSVTLQALQSANPSINCGNLQIGQLIKIP